MYGKAKVDEAEMKMALLMLLLRLGDRSMHLLRERVVGKQFTVIFRETE